MKKLIILLTVVFVMALAVPAMSVQTAQAQGPEVDIYGVSDCQDGLTIDIDVFGATESDLLVVGWAFFDENLGVAANWLFLDPTTVDDQIILEHLNVPAGSQTAFFAIMLPGSTFEPFLNIPPEELENMTEEDLQLLAFLFLASLSELPGDGYELVTEECNYDGTPNRSNVEVDEAEIEEALMPFLGMLEESGVLETLEGFEMELE